MDRLRREWTAQKILENCYHEKVAGIGVKEVSMWSVTELKCGKNGNVKKARK